MCAEGAKKYLAFFGIGRVIFVQTENKHFKKKGGGPPITETAKNKVFSFRRRAENERDEELRALREGLIRTRTLINQAYVGFNGTGDPDLIESYVFEINSLQARYSYLLRRVKELEGQEA